LSLVIPLRKEQRLMVFKNVGEEGIWAQQGGCKRRLEEIA
jgi:hypothetical protein